MKKIVIVVLTLLVLLPLNIAYAQYGNTSGNMFYGDFKPVVGKWSEYQITTSGNAPSKMKVAIVGKEGNAYWYETIIEGKREGQIITKTLVSGDPSDQNNIKRMIIKRGNEPAMEMPVQMMQQPYTAKAQKPTGKIIDKGKEKIKVPAGTFSTKHTQYKDENILVDTWVNQNVSPYGMIKSKSKDHEMVLIGYGSGAKTLITETPQKFKMPAMPKGFPKDLMQRKGGY
ncbi:MAG: hypothetical protein ABIJ37_03300 [Pseudomonadota bacterium]